MDAILLLLVGPACGAVMWAVTNVLVRRQDMRREARELEEFNEQCRRHVVLMSGIADEIQRLHDMVDGTVYFGREEMACRDAIEAEPDDDAPRLIYADWLEENGQDREGMILRLQVELRQLWRGESRQLAERAGPAVLLDYLDRIHREGVSLVLWLDGQETETVCRCERCTRARLFYELHWSEWYLPAGVRLDWLPHHKLSMSESHASGRVVTVTRDDLFVDRLGRLMTLPQGWDLHPLLPRRNF